MLHMTGYLDMRSIRTILEAISMLLAEIRMLGPGWNSSIAVATEALRTQLLDVLRSPLQIPASVS